MKFLVRRYFSGYCTFEIEAADAQDAYSISRTTPLDYDEILATLEDWRDCDQVEEVAIEH